MKVVIDIPEDVLKRTVFYREFRDLNDCITTIKALEKAIPLPKGCGRLIDGDKLLDDIEKQYPASVSETDKCKRYARLVYYWAVKNSQTIIEADKGSE